MVQAGFTLTGMENKRAGGSWAGWREEGLAEALGGSQAQGQCEEGPQTGQAERSLWGWPRAAIFSEKKLTRLDSLLGGGPRAEPKQRLFWALCCLESHQARNRAVSYWDPSRLPPPALPVKSPRIRGPLVPTFQGAYVTDRRQPLLPTGRPGTEGLTVKGIQHKERRRKEGLSHREWKKERSHMARGEETGGRGRRFPEDGELRRDGKRESPREKGKVKKRVSPRCSQSKGEAQRGSREGS